MKKQDISSRLKLDGSVGKQSVAQDSTSVGKGKSDEEELDNFEKQTNSAENEEVQHVVTKELYDLDKQTISAEIDEVQPVVADNNDIQLSTSVDRGKETSNATGVTSDDYEEKQILVEGRRGSEGTSEGRGMRGRGGGNGNKSGGRQRRKKRGIL